MGLAVELSDLFGRRIKLHDLHVLMTVVEAGSMGKAAQRLNISQPAVSRSIAELEHQVGVTLLDRSHQGVEATAYGRALLDGGLAMFDDLRQAVRNIEYLADPTAGEVRIGAIPPLTASFVSHVVDRLSQRFPRIVFHLVSFETDRLHRELSERNVDLLIARKFSASADEQENFEFLFEDHYVVVAGAKSPWARRRTIRLEDLLQEMWVMPPANTPPCRMAMDAFRASGLDFPRVSVFTQYIGIPRTLLATGRYLAISPVSGLRFPAGLVGLKVLPIVLPTPRRAIGIITLKNRTLSPVAKLFIEHARELAKPLATKMSSMRRRVGPKPVNQTKP